MPSGQAENHWRMQLNNYLQSNGGTKMLSWEVYPSGPSHEVIWTATVFVRGAPYAKCTSSRQNVAMEEAARQALQTLRQLEMQAAQASHRARPY